MDEKKLQIPDLARAKQGTEEFLYVIEAYNFNQFSLELKLAELVSLLRYLGVKATSPQLFKKYVRAWQVYSISQLYNCDQEVLRMVREGDLPDNTTLQYAALAMIDMEDEELANALSAYYEKQLPAATT